MESKDFGEGTGSFYQGIQAFPDFRGITQDANFHPVPDDWDVIVTDVRGSTAAIESGRYKDVNVVGAAAIACVQNVLGRLEIPFVFGGDGATILIPASASHQVSRELLGLKALSARTFQLELRVGAVSVAELRKDGARLDVAKFRLAGRKSIAIFRGGGLTLAEKKIKNESERFEFRGPASETTALDRLSCRWNPIPTKNGKVVSLLIQARTLDQAGTYRNILGHLETIGHGSLESVNPMNIPGMSYKSFGQCVREERRYHASPWTLSFLKRVGEIALAVLIFRFKIPPLFFSPSRYAASMGTHSDYRKFDDTLRMILDCSPDQVHQLRGLLEPLREKGDIFYGLHESDNALMTCYVHGLDEGNHIHFIDGGNGGYAMAAKQMKAQIKAATTAAAN